MLGVQIRWGYFYVLCVASLVALYLGLTGDNRFGMITNEHDKLAHFVTFLLESWLFTRSIESSELDVESLLVVWRRWGGIYGRQYDEMEEESTVHHVSKYSVSIYVCIVLGAVGSECLQLILSWGRRKFDVMDVVYNICGSLVGIGTAYWIER
ncbi:uncharacterized protein Ecym_7177 [Eremothecium cymbalariae DBVPG|uniref:VanZ-like domain-containing protein n=1 Tax=Eremothecium cymbalariae (strain CBS 270.75 / DBVPG 7215 / KCTC 17166 / NRRL Y-17582) TaxID=931890 RepID=G8JW10_ERECY|nr:hypothetical protein Ecym_7177 [Eremothecium cymbalariae DBVPG\